MDNTKVAAAISIILLSAGSCYQAPEKRGGVSFLSITRRENYENEDAEPEKKVEEPAISVFRVDVSDILRVRLD